MGGSQAARVEEDPEAHACTAQHSTAQRGGKLKGMDRVEEDPEAQACTAQRSTAYRGSADWEEGWQRSAEKV